MSHDTAGKIPTRLSLFASGWFVMYAMTFLPGIHSETSWRGMGVIPRRGTMFWCFKCFHTAAVW